VQYSLWHVWQCVRIEVGSIRLHRLHSSFMGSIVFAHGLLVFVCF